MNLISENLDQDVKALASSTLKSLTVDLRLSPENMKLAIDQAITDGLVDECMRLTGYLAVEDYHA